MSSADTTAAFKPERIDAKNLPPLCCACAAPLAATMYYCNSCWWMLPGKERAALCAMHLRGQEMNSKIIKCNALLAAKRPALA